jgi:hypothetical protein
MKIQTWRAALDLLKAGGVMQGHTITMPDGTVHDCWHSVRVSLERRTLLTKNPRGEGWVLRQKS